MYLYFLLTRRESTVAMALLSWRSRVRSRPSRRVLIGTKRKNVEKNIEELRGVKLNQESSETTSSDCGTMVFVKKIVLSVRGGIKGLSRRWNSLRPMHSVLRIIEKGVMNFPRRILKPSWNICGFRSREDKLGSCSLFFLSCTKCDRKEFTEEKNCAPVQE